MKRIRISRKKALFIGGIAAVSLVAALIPKVMKAAKCHKYSSSF